MHRHRYDEGQSENKKDVLLFLNNSTREMKKSNVIESFYSAIGIVNTETYETLLCSGSVIG